MTTLSRRTVLAAVGAMPIAASPAASASITPPSPEELARWHYEQAQFWLDVIHAKTGLASKFGPRLCISHRMPPFSDD